MYSDEFRLPRRRGRPKKIVSNDPIMDPDLCKEFKLLKMHISDDEKTSSRPRWIAEFNEPVDFRTLSASLFFWKLSHIENYATQTFTPTNTVRSRGRPKGSKSKRRSSEEFIE